jgi:putative PEP-CTERM system TPR-repeat lipoprotein
MTVVGSDVKRSNFWLLLCSVLLQLTLASCSLGKNDQEALASANRSFEEGNYSKAIIELKQLLQNSPTNNDARRLLARSYLKKGNGVSAEKEINRVSNDEPPGADEQSIRLLSWDMQGKYKQIIEDYEQGGFDEVDPMTVWGVVSFAYLDQRDLEKGTALAAKMLEKDKRSVIALRALAQAASVRKDDSEALDYLNKAYEIDQGDYNVLSDLGSLYAKLEDQDRAIEMLEGALSLIGESQNKRDEYAINVRLIQLLFHLNRLDESAVYLKNMEAKYKNNPYLDYLSGFYSYLKKDYEVAAGKLTRAHSAMPNHLQTILLLGAAHFSEDNLEQANLLLTRYVNEVPTHLQARKLLGEVKLRLDKPQEVLALLETDGAENSDQQILTMIGLAASQSGEYSKGVEYLKKAVRANPGDTRIREELARLYINHGDFDEAISELGGKWAGESTRRDSLLIYSYIQKQDFDSARKLSDQILSRGRAPGDLYLRAMIELNSGNRSHARRYLTEAVNGNSDFVPGQLALARMDLEDGRLGEGGDRLNLVLANAPGNVNAMVLLAQISERSGSRDDAIAWLEKAVETDGDTWMPRVILARYYLRRKEPEKAEVYLDHKVLRDSDNPTVVSLLAAMEQQTGQYDAAESTINKLLDKDPSSEVAYLQLADLQYRKGDIEAARMTLQKLQKEMPSSLKGLLLRYKLEMREKNYQQVESIIEQLRKGEKTKLLSVTLEAKYLAAKGDLQKAVNTLKAIVSPKAPFALVQQLTDLYFRNNDTASAINLLNEWKKSNKDNHQAQLALAIIYQKTGKIDSALKLYSDLLETEPRNIVALNNLALLKFDQNPQDALAQAKRAYDITGNATHSVVDTYAWLTHRSGDTAEALKILAPIMDKASDPSILYHFAVMLAESDKESEAKEVLVTITKEPADFPELDEAKKLLGEITRIKG